LGSFLFSGRDAVEKPVAVLSGGEKSRLALAKLLLDPPNFLLMDEPTTHLDIPSIDALIGALKQFEGTIVFVSHDVHFIRNVATTVIHVSAGQLTPYAGDYQYFLDKTRATNAREALVAGEQLANFQPAMAAQPVEKKKIFLSREEKRAANLAREAKLAEKRAAVKRVQALEQTIGQLEQQQQALTDALQNPEAYDKGGNAIHLNRELSAVTEQIAITTLEWEAATKALEQWEQKDETVGE
jgi:ATP-binding cassette subfamily F protein 3